MPQEGAIYKTLHPLLEIVVSEVAQLFVTVGV